MTINQARNNARIMSRRKETIFYVVNDAEYANDNRGYQYCDADELDTFYASLDPIECYENGKPI